jgi:rare lipoprotein A
MRPALLAIVAMAMAACSTTSGFFPYYHPSRHASLPSGAGGHHKTGSPYTVSGITYYPLATAYGYDRTGIASWYGPNFNGGLTADGERYDMHAMSAAHPTLPLPTLVRVTNLDNGRQVIVRVNDRGPFVKHRLIDLSYAAARALGYAKRGTARVRVQALAGLQDGPVLAQQQPAPTVSPVRQAVPTPPPAPLPAATGVITTHPTGAMYVQLGAFSSVDNANRLSRSLAGDFRQIGVYSAGNGGIHLYKVWIGPFQDIHKIERTVMSLQSHGIRDTIVVIE